jgi:formate dehydrogenase iron-sulfur subunit
MSKGMLIDTTLCIGCRACQVACKSWNNRQGEHTTFSDSWTNPQHLNNQVFNQVIFKEIAGPHGQVQWHFIPHRCFHCLEPACVSACPVGALQKLPSGPVVYDDARCFGCRYCFMACPFYIPKYDWDTAVPYVRKCTFCADRQALGLQPACSASCPTGALLFGERAELLKEAHRRIDANRGKYYPVVYGEKIAGGTSKIYLTALSMEELGLSQYDFRTDLGDVSPKVAGEAWMKKVVPVGLTVGGLCVGLHYLYQRRAEVQAQKGKED